MMMKSLKDVSKVTINRPVTMLGIIRDLKDCVGGSTRLHNWILNERLSVEGNKTLTDNYVSFMLVELLAERSTSPAIKSFCKVWLHEATRLVSREIARLPENYGDSLGFDRMLFSTIESKVIKRCRRRAYESFVKVMSNHQFFDNFLDVLVQELPKDDEELWEELMA